MPSSRRIPLPIGRRISRRPPDRRSIRPEGAFARHGRERLNWAMSVVPAGEEVEADLQHSPPHDRRREGQPQAAFHQREDGADVVRLLGKARQESRGIAGYQDLAPAAGRVRAKRPRQPTRRTAFDLCRSPSQSRRVDPALRQASSTTSPFQPPGRLPRLHSTLKLSER